MQYSHGDLLSSTTDEKCPTTERHYFIHNFIFISFTYLLGLYSTILCIYSLYLSSTVARSVAFFIALRMVSSFSFSLLCWNYFHSFDVLLTVHLTG